MLNKSQSRAKSALRRPMSDVSNEGWDNRDRFLKKEANKTVESKGSLDRLLVVRSDLSDLISQIDNLVAQAIKQKEISKKGYQEIESFSGFLSSVYSSLKPWFARLQEALTSATTVTSKDQTKTHSTPFPVKTKLTSNTPQQNLTISQSLTNTSTVTLKSRIESHTTPYPYKRTQQSLLTSRTDSKKLDLLVSPSPLVSWRADNCTVVDGGKQLFLLTPLQKTQLEVSKAAPPTKPLINVQYTGTDKKHENNVVDSLRISEQECETGFCRTTKTVHPTKTLIMLQDTSTVITHEGHGKDGVPVTESMSKARFCSTSNTVLPTKPLPNIPSTSTSKNCEKDVKDRVPLAEPVCEEGFYGLSKSVLLNEPLNKVPDVSGGKNHEKHEKFGVPITKPVHYLKDINQKKEVSGTLDWFFSPPKTCVLMEPSDKKRLKELSTPVDKNNRNRDSCEKNLVSTPWNNLYMSATCTKKGEATLKRELWTRFEAVSTGDLRLNTDIFQNEDGKGFLDLLDEASN